MFSRKRDLADSPATSPAAGQSASSADVAATSSAADSTDTPSSGAPSKGRPTPKRSESQAKNKRPLVPNDRKAARKASKEKVRAERNREYQAMQTGDERFMPARDKGPVRRYVRDYVDARWNVGEFFLPVAFVFIFMNLIFLQNPTMATLVLLALYAVVFITLIDVVVMWQRLKRRLRDKFGTLGTDGKKEYFVPRGTMMYAAMRALQIRRSRLPKPMHKKHGHWPE
ncbi:DUF3043 domain-containing protein [Isoptericola sp. AK164]|uniref:DUF3043 domain-containing protein n=1 Tax=Isoptericola sp. AK164 TaxID=3024246 RepID=UPI00241856AF|nr:DUF3043 domain-containing protein [Isoptericola sp. AK164]